MEQEKTRGLSGGTLKIIALVTMVIDHISALYLANGQMYQLGRTIGRLAFPIYCFLVVEGFYHTRSVARYAVRLFLFALISEVPFDSAFHNRVYDRGHQNVFFTLFLGVVLMYLIQMVRTRIEEIQYVKKSLALLLSYVAVFTVAFFLHADYGVNGLVLILLFYLFHGKKVSVAIVNIMMNILMGSGGTIQVYGSLSAIPIWFYNGKKGISLKYFFYLAYPVHLLILYYWIR